MKKSGDWLVTGPRVTRTFTRPAAMSAGTTQSVERTVPARLGAMGRYVAPLSMVICSVLSWVVVEYPR